MAKQLKYSSEIADNRTIQAWHVSQSIEALNAQDAYDIKISGSLNVDGDSPFNVTGSTILSGSLKNPTIQEDDDTNYRTVMVSPTTGEFFYTGSYGGGGGGGSSTSGTSGTSGVAGSDGSSGTSGTSGAACKW